MLAYWVNVGEKVAIVHNYLCGHCHMDDKGNKLEEWAKRENWWGLTLPSKLQ